MILPEKAEDYLDFLEAVCLLGKAVRRIASVYLSAFTRMNALRPCANGPSI